MSFPRSRPLLYVVPFLLLGASACASGSGHPSAGRTTASPAALRLDERADRSTVSVALGTSVVVTLHSTYWSGLTSGAPKILTPEGTAQVAPAHSCPPGEGCGTVRLGLRAAHPGTARINARRATCGEARACTGTQGSFVVTVRVGEGSHQ